MTPPRTPQCPIWDHVLSDAIIVADIQILWAMSSCGDDCLLARAQQSSSTPSETSPMRQFPPFTFPFLLAAFALLVYAFYLAHGGWGGEP